MRLATTLIACALAVGAACSERSIADPKPGVKAGPKKVQTTMAPTVDWKLTKAADGLHVAYTVTNGTDQPIWVASRLLQNTAAGTTMKATDRVIVVDGGETDLVRLVRGMAPGAATGGRERPPPSPAMVKVAAHGELAGAAVVPLPLAAWHNYSNVPALGASKTRAVFELTYVAPSATEDDFWDVPLDDGTTVAAPSPNYLKTAAKQIVSAPLALPQ